MVTPSACVLGCVFTQTSGVQRSRQVDELEKTFRMNEAKVESFNRREQLFEEEPLEYLELKQLREEFNPYYTLWDTAWKWQTNHEDWMKTPRFRELKYKEIAERVEEWYKEMYVLEKKLHARAPEPAKKAAEIRADLAEFRKHLPIIEWLSTAGLEQRHWNEIGQELGHPDRFTREALQKQGLTLEWLLSPQVSAHAHSERLEEICSRAEKEYSLRQALNKMKAEWNVMSLEIAPYRKTDTFIVKKSEDILALLDDQIMKTQAMRGSPYITGIPLESEAKQWEDGLQLMASIMEEWLVWLLWLIAVLYSDSHFAVLVRLRCSNAKRRGCTWSPYSPQRISCGRCLKRAAALATSTRTGARPCKLHTAPPTRASLCPTPRCSLDCG